MAEMDPAEQLAGTSTHQKDVKRSEVKELNPVRFFDGAESAIPTSLDLRPGVTNVIRPKAPTAVTVNPDGSAAGSPNRLETFDVPATEGETETPTPTAAAVKAEGPKAPAPA